MAQTVIYSAIGTPLTNDELNVEGLRSHLQDQWDGGIDGVLVAGTMGAMPLLTNDTYQDLIKRSVELCQGQGAILVGVGDQSFARTLERIEVASQYNIDGVVILAPSFFPFAEEELAGYYSSIAERSKVPLYLYDLPQRTNVSLSLDMILRLAAHPNIVGIKISGQMVKARQLLRDLAGFEGDFSVFLAESTSLDLLIRGGIGNHLDGIYSVVPRLARTIATSAEDGDDRSCQKAMQLLDQLLSAVVKHGVFSAMTALVNHKGIPGNFAPAPFKQLKGDSLDALFDEPGVREALRIG